MHNYKSTSPKEKRERHQSRLHTNNLTYATFIGGEGELIKQNAMQHIKSWSV
jgi:hypothetical protein